LLKPYEAEVQEGLREIGLGRNALFKVCGCGFQLTAAHRRRAMLKEGFKRLALCVQACGEQKRGNPRGSYSPATEPVPQSTHSRKRLHAALDVF